jgi:hypothetical protein
MHMNRRKFIAATVAGTGLLALDGTTLAAEKHETSTLPLRRLGKLGWMISIVGFGDRLYARDA